MGAWTDERLDDLAAALRPLPAQMAKNTEAIERLSDDMRAVRDDLSALHRQMIQIGWALVVTLVAVGAAVIIA